MRLRLLSIQENGRQKRGLSIKVVKKLTGVKDELRLSPNALSVLKSRYLLKDDKGKIIETPAKLFKRVAKKIASIDKKYNKKSNIGKLEKEFYSVTKNLEFLPNSPTLMNAGTELGQLSACFVLPVEDSLRSIFDSVKYASLIQQSGGGTGFNFSKLRPNGDIVKSTHGVASGPVSFMKIFDRTTEVIKQGGKRRGANMGILNVDHPDITDFITVKTKENILNNFNISVGVTVKFMDAVKKNKNYSLINPRTKKTVKKLNARHVFRLIVNNAWLNGDPGIIFIDEIDKHNPTPTIGKMEATNPCGEVPALPYESCNLGSINLSKIIENNQINWEKLGGLVRVGVHFLDNVIDANKFPLEEIGKITKANRKIGLGVMGFAEMLIKLDIPYDSEKAVRLAERIMRFISNEARKISVELAGKRGSFPNFKKSIFIKKYKKLRNATLTTVAPTGTISIIANCSSGIEPLFAIAFVRDVLEGTKLLEVNSLFEEIAKKQRFYSEKLMLKIAKQGSIKNFKEIPKKVRRLFVTALDIKPEWHLKIQAAFQKYTDNAVSKTINLPKKATKEDVKRIFLLAYRLKCKGTTIYRYGSKKEQVLYLNIAEKQIRANSEYSGGCPSSVCVF